MTDRSKQTQDPPPEPALSLSWQDMALVRIRPADLARLLGVSRQTVSQWIAKGIVTLLPDGRLDPVRATREVIERGNPGTIRVRVLREAMAEARREFDKALAKQAAEFAAELAEARRDADAWFDHVELFTDALKRHAASLRATSTDAEFNDLVSDLWFEFEHVHGRCASEGGGEAGDTYRRKDCGIDVDATA